jgi:hypothetical protein
MRHRHDLLPTPAELATAPEIAILASLEASLDVALVALVAAHEELHATDDGRDHVTGLVACAADNVIDKAQALACAIIGYRLLVNGQLQPSDR